MEGRQLLVNASSDGLVHQKLYARLHTCSLIAGLRNSAIRRRAIEKLRAIANKPTKSNSCPRGRSVVVSGGPNAIATPTKLLDNFKNSAVLSPRLSSVTSWSYAALCFAAALSSLAAFSALSNLMTGSAMQGGFTGDLSQLSFLDLHDGYTPDEARELLGAWGPYGRRLYLLVEGIDCTLYHAGYRGFLVVVANRLAGALKGKWPEAAPLALLAALPVLLAGLDFLEDAGQVAMVFGYEISIPEDKWQALVGAASFANQSKWALCRCTLALLALEATALLWFTIFPSRESAEED